MRAWLGLALGLLLLCLCGMAGPAEAAATRILEVRVTPEDGRTRLMMLASGPLAVKVFTLANPDRVVVDLPVVAWPEQEFLALPEGGLVANVRFGRFDPATSRLVLDLKEPARVASSVLKSTGKGGNRLELDLVPTGATIPGKARQSIETRAGGSEPGPVREAAAGVAGAAKHPGPPPPRSEGRRVVAVDAGHGGQDPGAIGLNDLPEKSITLSAARELKRQLEATGRYKVVMTRERDVYISLAKRVEIARAASAELFISLHADKHDNARVRGASVYTLSETASDAETEAYAKRENSSDLVAGIDLAEKYDEEVARILISLVQQSTMNCSAVFASSLVKQLKKQSRVLQRPHRFAGFRVLKAPDMPSVLVELGYLSNKSDEKMLVNSNQRSRLLKAVVLAVNSYFARQSC